MSYWRPSAKAGWALALIVAGCAGALASGRPEGVVLVVPFALVLVVGLAVAPRGDLMVQSALPVQKVGQGERFSVEVLLGPAAGPWARWCRVEVGVARDAAYEGVPGRDIAGLFGLGAPQEHGLHLTARQWGRRSPGRVVWLGSDLLGMFQADGDQPVAEEVTVFPRREVLDQVLAPARAAVPAGAHLVRAKGVGMELAGVRPYSRGDRAREINWRASARHGADLFTNERHPERAGEVVLLVDTFDPGALDRAVCACWALARAFLEQRDRVGLVKFGGWLRWLRPGGGPRHEWVVLDVLLGTRSAESSLYRSVGALPPRALPAGALLVAVSSLEGAGAVEAITDMAGRGLDVAVLHVEPALPAPPAGRGAAAHRRGPVREAEARAAAQLWRLSRQQVDLALRQGGVPCATWRPGQPLAAPVGELVLWAARVRGARR